MGMRDMLFPVSEDRASLEWKQYLTTNTAVAPGLAQWRYGEPVAIQLYSMQRVDRFPTVTLHPGHRDYSSIETAKRDREEYEQRATKIAQRKRFANREQGNDGGRFPELRIANPKLPQYNLPKFNKVGNRRLPRGLL